VINFLGGQHLCQKKKNIHALHDILGVNFINVLLAAFSCADPKSLKRLYNLTVFFTLLCLARAKAARKTLMKLTPGRNF